MACSCLPRTLVSWTCPVPKVAGKGNDLVTLTGNLVFKTVSFRKCIHGILGPLVRPSLQRQENTREHKDSERRAVAWTSYSEQALT